MHVHEPTHVDSALYHGLEYLKDYGTLKPSRVGPTLAAPGLYVTKWYANTPRVSVDPVRDANPFFHLFESMWMLAGRNDVDFISRFNPRMAEFSEDGDTQHGAYGFRWREWFAFDQLEHLVQLLRSDPLSRRAVLTMWSPNGDLVSSEGYGGLSAPDVPCNTQAYFRNVNGALDLTVTARSNDMVWGAYGANIVHFSFLHEYMAAATGLRVGLLYQISNDMHVYTERPDVVKLYAAQVRLLARHPAEYRQPLVGPGEKAVHVLSSADEFCDDNHLGAAQSSYFTNVVLPMSRAWTAYKNDDLDVARSHLVGPARDAWLAAADAWLARRQVRRAAKAAGVPL